MDWPDDAQYNPYGDIMRIGTAEEAARWAPACLEYFAHFSDGVYSEAAYLQVLLPETEVHVSPEVPDDLVIGHAGSDGIYFCFRAGMVGVWAYYGIDGEHKLLAHSLKFFVTGWLQSTISV
jgi:hypothetical protein